MHRHRPTMIATVGTLVLLLSVFGCIACGVALYQDSVPRFKCYLTPDQPPPFIAKTRALLGGITPSAY